VVQLEDCAVALYRRAGDSSEAEAYLQPQSSFDDNPAESEKQMDNG